MKYLKIVTFLTVLFLQESIFAQGERYELRTYTAQPGKLQALLNRFETKTMALIAKYGMENVGYWVPVNNEKNQLIYLLKHKAGADITKTWNDFGADPAWKKIVAETEKDGKLVAEIQSTLMKTTDYSPNNLQSVGDRVFELRKYQASPYNLGLLDARFRNHTLALFQKHNMTNIIYFHPFEPVESMYYFICHANVAAAKTNFEQFVKDPEWMEARAASEKLAKRGLTTGITSEFLIPTSFSPLK